MGYKRRPSAPIGPDLNDVVVDFRSFHTGGLFTTDARLEVYVDSKLDENGDGSRASPFNNLRSALDRIDTQAATVCWLRVRTRAFGGTG